MDMNQKQGNDAKKAMLLKNDKNERKHYVLSAWNGFVKKYVHQNSSDNKGAAIFELKNGEELSATEGFKISTSELRAIFVKVQNGEQATETGITINDVNYQVVIADGRFGIYAKNGTIGCSICKTESLLLVWIHDTNNNGINCNKEIMRLGDCFRSWEL